MPSTSIALPTDLRIAQNFPLEFIEVSQEIGRYEETHSEVEQLISLTNLSPNSKVLDIPCGIGRHAEIFQQKGFDVTAIDASSAQIEYAKVHLPGPNYQVADMRSLDQLPNRHYSLVMNMYSSFGYFQSVDEDFHCLQQFFDLLDDNGSLIMQLSDLERSHHNLGGKPLPLRRNEHEELNFDWDTQTLMVNYYSGDQAQSFVNMRIYSKEQLNTMLTEVGFTSVSLYGDLNGNPKTPADRLVIHAKK